MRAFVRGALFVAACAHHRRPIGRTRSPDGRVCRSDLPDVHALIDYAKTLPYDSSRVLLEVFGGVERR